MLIPVLKEFRRLERQESDLRPYKCLDKRCGKRFKVKCNMKKHFRISHLKVGFKTLK